MPMVGRERELRKLGRGLAGAAAKQGSIVMLSGEPGIGKTSLLHELGIRAEDQGFDVLSFRSLPQHLSNKEMLWQRIWRGLAEARPSGHIARSSAGASQGAKLKLETSTDTRLYPEGEQAADAFAAAALFPLILDLLLDLSLNCPLLITVDDIHYADEPSLDLLAFLSYSLDCLPVLLALAYDPSGFAGRPQVGWMVERIAARGQWVELGPLGEDASSAILQQVTGFMPDQRTVRFLRQLTGGNPRFILECSTVMSDPERMRSQLCSSSEVRIPSAVRVAIKERLKPLSPEARKILEIGALFPNAFDPQLISEVADFDEAEADAAIFELQTAGLIRSETEHTCDYSHGFTRELVYGEISLTRKSYLHRRIASVLLVHNSLQVNGSARQIAEHLMRSGEPQMIERAIRHAQFTAKHFASVRDFARAAEMYSVAINGIELQSTADAGDLCGMLIGLSEALREAGQIEAAQQTFCRAARLAEDLGDKQKMVQIALGVPDLGWPFANSTNSIALVLAQKALASMPVGDSSERARLMARVAGELSYLEDQSERSEELFAEAVEMGRRLADQDDRIMLQMYRLRDLLLRHPNAIDERVSNADQIMAMAYKTGENDALFSSAFAKLCALYEIGNTGCLDTQIALMQQAAALTNRPECNIALLNVRTGRALHEGRLDQAQEFYRQARQAANICGLGSLADQCWPCLILPLREQGRLAELAPLAESNWSLAPSSYAARALQCWLSCELGNTAQAQSQLRLLAVERFAKLKNGSCSVAAAALLSEVSAELKMPEYARLLYDFLLPFQNRHVVVEPAFAPFGSVSRYLGKLALAASDYDRAVAHFEDAVNADREMGARPWASYSLLELAKSLLIRGAFGDQKRAAELLRTVRAEAANLKMHRLAKLTNEITERGCSDSDSDRVSEPDFVGTLVINETTREPAEHPCAVVPSQPAALSLRREVAGWELTFHGRTIRLKELRGLTLIAYLLSWPNQEVSTLELASLGRNGEVITDRKPPSDLGPVLDESAKRAYRARVQELEQEVEQARSAGDEQGALKAEEELRFLTREIARAVGLFGRDRNSGSDAERARVRVTNSIKFAIDKIGQHHSMLGAYLHKTIRTGASCCYCSESPADIVWKP